MRFLIPLILAISPALAQSPPVAVPVVTPPNSAISTGEQGTPTTANPFPLKRGHPPRNRDLLRASEACHRANPVAADAARNCEVPDAQIKQRASAPGADPAIVNRAKDLP